MNVVAFRMMCRSVSAIVTYHDRENMPRSGGICVANHTTVIDAVILMQDRPYAILGQKHSGFLGWAMDTISKSAKHVWFERSEASDRKYVSMRMLEHVGDDRNYPILLFPEGTCINNTAVMMFKKGSFELPTTVYPVAIKYNPWFGDAFWNSSRHGMLLYLFRVMSSWALVADVWYLPSMTKHDDEDGIQFAQRVKTCIARRGGLIDSVWDGQLKRMKVKKEKVEEKQRELGRVFGWKNMQVTEDEEEVEVANELEGNKCVTENVTNNKKVEESVAEEHTSENKKETEEVASELEENKSLNEEVASVLEENKSLTEEVTNELEEKKSLNEEIANELEECATEENDTKPEKSTIETAETEEITSNLKPEVGYVMIEENSCKTEEECKNDAEDISSETNKEEVKINEEIEENNSDTSPSDEQSVKNVTFSISNEPSCVETQ